MILISVKRKKQKIRVEYKVAYQGTKCAVSAYFVPWYGNADFFKELMVIYKRTRRQVLTRKEDKI